MVAFVYFRIVASVISLGQKLKKQRLVLHLLGWCMMIIVSKNHIQTPWYTYVKLSGA